MRISDWSSDVCSSDLSKVPPTPRTAHCPARCSAHPKKPAPGTATEDFRQLFSRLTSGRPAAAVMSRGSAQEGPGQSRHDHPGQRPPMGRTASSGEGKRSEEHTSELQSLMRNSYAVF